MDRWMDAHKEAWKKLPRKLNFSSICLLGKRGWKQQEKERERWGGQFGNWEEKEMKVISRGSVSESTELWSCSIFPCENSTPHYLWPWPQRWMDDFRLGVVVVEEGQKTEKTHILLRRAVTAGAGTSSWGPALPDADVATQVSKRRAKKMERGGKGLEWDTQLMINTSILIIVITHLPRTSATTPPPPPHLCLSPLIASSPSHTTRMSHGTNKLSSSFIRLRPLPLSTQTNRLICDLQIRNHFWV